MNSLKPIADAILVADLILGTILFTLNLTML